MQNKTLKHFYNIFANVTFLQMFYFTCYHGLSVRVKDRVRSRITPSNIFVEFRS